MPKGKANSQVNQLVALLQSMAKIGGNAPTPVSQAPARRRRRQRRKARTPGPSRPTSDGSEMIMSGVDVVEIPAGSSGGGVSKIRFGPFNNGLPRLSKFVSLYEKYTLLSLVVEFVPSLGSSEGGTVVAGWDSDPSTDRSTFATVSTLSPRLVTALSQKGQFSVPPSLYRAEYYCSQTGARPAETVSPGAIHIWNPVAKKAGYLNLRYRVRFSGPGGQ
jgi:hypothetical protein